MAVISTRPPCGQRIFLESGGPNETDSLWVLFEYKNRPSWSRVSIMRIRRSWDQRIFIMGIPYAGEHVFIVRWARAAGHWFSPLVRRYDCAYMQHPQWLVISGTILFTQL